MNGLVQPGYFNRHIELRREEDLDDAIQSKVDDYLEDGVLFGHKADYDGDDIDEMWFRSLEYNDWRMRKTVARKYAEIKRLGKEYQDLKQQHEKRAIREVAEGIVRGEL